MCPRGCGYSSNERKFLTLAMLAPEYAKPGNDSHAAVGRRAASTSKPTVESHKQVADPRDRLRRCRTRRKWRAGYADGGWRAAQPKKFGWPIKLEK